MRTLLAWACAALVAASGHAMEFRRVGDTLVLSGPVVGDDLARLKDQLALGRPRLVLLHQSEGGDLWNGLQLAHRVRDEGLATAVAGRCDSACALIFLGGVERSFSDGLPLASTMVGLHGAYHTQTKAALPEHGARMAWVIRQWSGWKFPADLAELAVYPRHPQDLVYSFHPLRFPPQKRPIGVMQCLLQDDASYRCTMLPGLDALAIGLVTNPEVLVLDDAVKAVLAPR